MAKRGRPPKTTNIHTLVNRMLDKKDVRRAGSKSNITRREAIIEALWQQVQVLIYKMQRNPTAGTNQAGAKALYILLEYAGGKPIPSNQLPKDDDDKENDDITFIERENFLDKLIAERKAALKKKEKKKPEGDPKGEPSK
jgi:hypothetical protein